MLASIEHLFRRVSFTKAVVWSCWLHCGVFVTFYYVATANVLPWNPDEPSGLPQIVILSEPMLESPVQEPPADFDIPNPEPLPVPDHWESHTVHSASTTRVAKQVARLASLPSHVPATPHNITREPEEFQALPQRRQIAADSFVEPQTRKNSPRPLRRVFEIPPIPQISVSSVICQNPSTKADFSGNVAPPYPPEAIRLGLEGDVLVQMLVSDTGRVERVEVIGSSGHAILDEPVIQWLSRWQGKPARQDGERVWTYQKQRVRFSFD